MEPPQKGDLYAHDFGFTYPFATVVAAANERDSFPGSTHYDFSDMLLRRDLQTLNMLKAWMRWELKDAHTQENDWQTGSIDEYFAPHGKPARELFNT